VSFYPVLIADGGVSGSALATSTNAALETWLTATPGALALTVVNAAVPLAASAATDDGAALGGALDRLRLRASGDLTTVTRELSAMEEHDLGRALNSLTGDIHSATAQLAALDGSAVTEIVRQETAAAPRSWARYQSQHPAFVDPSVQAQTSVVLVGRDFQVSGSVMAGAGAAYTTGTIAMNNSAETAAYVAPRAFGYVGFAAGGSVARLGASVARNSYQVRRSIRFTALLPEEFGNTPVFGGISRTAISAPVAMSADAWAEWARPVRFGVWDVSPSAGLRFSSSSQRALSESGAGSLSLTSTGQTTRTAQADMGIRIARTMRRFVPNASVAYRRDLSVGQSATRLQISDDTAGLFAISGVQLLPETMMLRAGTALVLGRVGLSVNFESQFGHGRVRQMFRIGADF
jgi:uncharacterized protein with beta-barrel porin domain